MKTLFCLLNRGRHLSLLCSIATPVFIALVLFPSPGTSVVSCFACNSHTNTTCLAGSLDAYKVKCQSKDQGCRKFQIFFDKDGTGDVKERVIRQCALTVPDKMCYKGYGASGGRFKRIVCDCEGDLCNNAPAPKAGLFRPISIAILSTLIAFFGCCF